MRGLEYEHELEYTVDGARVHTFRMGGEADFKANLDNMTKAGDAIDERGRITAEAQGRARTSSARRSSRAATAPNPTRLQPFIRSSTDTLDTSGHPHFDTFTITGPFNRDRARATRRAAAGFSSCRPATAPSEDACARKIIATLARRAYRGDVDRRRSPAAVRVLSTPGRQRGRHFRDAASQKALQRMLASPKFCFRVEHDPAGLAPATVYRISDLELASRLSFFLWSSIPDDAAARSSPRRTSCTLRPCSSSRCAACSPIRRPTRWSTNFAGQWLYLRNLKNMQPNSDEFPDFDDNLRQAFEREAELFFASIVHEDRNVLDLMTADYTFLNERLAQHYGIPNVYGSHFRRVTLTDDARRGLLGKGAMLMVTSHADRTSPVVRGKWMLDNLLERAGAADADQRAAAQRRCQSRRPRS